MRAIQAELQASQRQHTEEVGKLVSGLRAEFLTPYVGMKQPLKTICSFADENVVVSVPGRHSMTAPDPDHDLSDISDVEVEDA
jgi:hypothetical protein